MKRVVNLKLSSAILVMLSSLLLVPVTGLTDAERAGKTGLVQTDAFRIHGATYSAVRFPNDNRRSANIRVIYCG